mmetsp:Transcript_4632/g.8421  ORF Transcript_4632/g.8421 Transcript_4632/m.8421 type:complete len:220 (-) Transcript_4632:149-808(-)
MSQQIVRCPLRCCRSTMAIKNPKVCTRERKAFGAVVWHLQCEVRDRNLTVLHIRLRPLAAGRPVPYTLQHPLPLCIGVKPHSTTGPADEWARRHRAVGVVTPQALLRDVSRADSSAHGGGYCRSGAVKAWRRGARTTTASITAGFSGGSGSWWLWCGVGRREFGAWSPKRPEERPVGLLGSSGRLALLLLTQHSTITLKHRRKRCRHRHRHVVVSRVDR